MSEPDFDVAMLGEYFAAAVRHDPGDIYAQPRFVNLKLGFYASYELVKLAAEARKQALATTPVPRVSARTQARRASKVELSIPGSGAKLSIPLKYFLAYADVTMEATTPIGPPFAFDLADYLRRATTASEIKHHLTVTRTLGDAVHDVGAELARCGFVYHADLTRMSPSARKAYAKNLDDVTFVPADSAPDSPIYVAGEKDAAAYTSSKGFEFKRLLATTCTYDGKGEYFGKWTAEALEQPRRSFTGANLSTRYLAKTTGEYELEQGYYYGLLLSPVIQRLYRLSPDKKTGYRLDLLVNLDESMLIPPGADPEFETLPIPDLIIFKAQHGLPKGRVKGGLKTPTFAYHQVDEGAYARLADPQREVEGDLGKAAARSLRARSDFDWFVELAKLRFTEKLYPLDIKRAMEQAGEAGINEMTFLPAYRKASAAELAAPLWAWAGANPIRRAALEKTKALLEDEAILLVPQGLLISDNVKFVGCDADFAYARDLARDVTIKMPHAALIAELAERYKYKLLYTNSQGMIYVSQIIVWGGLLAMGGALVPGALAVRTVYRTVANRVRAYAIDKAITQVLIYEIPAMAALVADIVAGLFVGTYPKADLWQAFARGFFRGYAVNTLKKIFLNIDDGLAKAVLKEYHLYKSLKKLHHSVNQLSAKFDDLSAKLTRESVELLATKLEKTAQQSLQSALLLFHLISFLAHGEAEDALVGLSSALTQDPIARLQKAEWYSESKESVIASVVSVGQFLTGPGKMFFNAIDGVFEWVEAHEEALAIAALVLVAHRLAKQMADLQKTRSPKTSPKKIVVVVAGLIGGGAVLHVVTDGESTKIIGGLSRAIAQGLPGRSAPDAEHRGQLYGNALGALFFDQGLIGSSSALGRLAKHDKIAKRVRKKAKHGILTPLLSVLLQRYVIFFRKALGYDGKDGDIDDLVKDLSRWRTDPPELQRFEAFRGTETGVDVYEIMSIVINLDRFLESEVRDRWKGKWGMRLEAYEADLLAFRQDADALGVEALVKKHAPVVGYTLLMQLRIVVRDIRLAFKHMAAEVDVGLEDGSRLSILRFVEMLGFDLGDLDAVEKIFDEEVAAMAREFKKS